jgi:hypothetical protein
MDIFEMGNHELLILDGLPFQSKFVYIVEVRIVSLNADNAINIIFFYEYFMRDLL